MDARRAASSACASSEQARVAHAAASERTRELRRRLAAARRAVEEAEPQAVTESRRSAKDQARAAYEGERARATSDAQRAEALARWGSTLDRINRDFRNAQRRLAAARREATTLARLVIEAERAEQAARVAAGSAEAACLAARVRLASCEERVAGLPPPGGPGAPRMPAPVPGGPLQPDPVSVGGDGRSRSPAPGPPPPAPDRHASPPRVVRIGQGAATVIEAVLSGDRRWLEVVAATLAEHTGRPPARILFQLRELVDAVNAAAGERGYVSIDGEHPFWSRLTEAEDRDVLAGLLRLGFQAEPPHGWHAGRSPAPSDLSMALAYAGIEARAMRNLPTTDELRELPRSMRVDAAALLAAEAPDLALDHMVAMLEQRSDGLTALWDDWGHIRPVLLADPRTLAGRLEPPSPGQVRSTTV